MENKNWLSPFGQDFFGDRFLNTLVPRNFGDFFKTGNFGPSVDLKETDKEIILHADIPGVNQEDLDITIDENVDTRIPQKKLQTQAPTIVDRCRKTVIILYK